MCAADTRSVAVIGGGWAGCAAAVELARKKCRVTLFESSRTLGGRARRVELNGMSLDNGQHIMLGAYRETLRMLRIVGIDARDAFLSLPLQMRYPEGTGGMDFIAPRLPAPLHVLVALLRASDLDRDDKMSLARFSTTARWMQWKLDNDCSVAELLDRFDQTDRLIQLMWRPLCIAALNTPPERASAQIFLNVLRDSLGARRAASDMLLPKADLSALFPDHAATFVKSNGGEIHLGAIVRAVKQDDSGWTLEVDNASSGLSTQRFDSAIIATQATHAATLLGSIPGTPRVPDFDYEPITTCYLQYDPSIRLTQPFFALLDEPESGRWGQFVFDRGQLDNRYAGLLAVVVSASTEAIELGHERLCAAIARQLGDAFKAPAFEKPMWSRAISEKRATFACTPALSRPANETGVDGLLLAGDYTDSDYPATLEAAVRSGIRAAHLAA
jgi:squalene-associated FAD-dependent desaturase